MKQKFKLSLPIVLVSSLMTLSTFSHAEPSDIDTDYFGNQLTPYTEFDTDAFGNYPDQDNTPQTDTRVFGKDCYATCPELMPTIPDDDETTLVNGHEMSNSEIYKADGTINWHSLETSDEEDRMRASDDRAVFEPISDDTIKVNTTERKEKRHKKNVNYSLAYMISEGKQKEVLSEILNKSGYGCGTASKVLLQGEDRDGAVYWNISCSNGQSYSIQIPPNPQENTRILECSIMRVLGINCFEKW